MTWEGLSPPYATIVADPPWPFVWNGQPGGRRSNATPMRYGTISLEEIAAFDVGSLAAPAAHLYLWVTPELNRRGAGVVTAEAWGFSVVDEIIWEKPNFGMGVFPRHCHEPLLVCRRGDLPFTASRDVRSVQRWSQTMGQRGGKSHSAKFNVRAGRGGLDEVERSDRLFARAPRLGWDHWGFGYETEHAS